MGEVWNMSAEGRANISAAAKARYQGRSISMTCPECGLNYDAIRSQIERGRGRFCSRACKGQASRGIRPAPETEFQKGLNPWNKGLELPKYSGEKNPNWKAADVTYSGLHKWLMKNMGRSDHCAQCGAVENLHIANRTGTYDRDPNNWFTLCRACHIAFDHADPKRPNLRGYRGNSWIKQ